MNSDHYSPEQFAAATSKARKVLISAAAGSGKTRSLVGRACHLLEMGFSPRAMCFVTFTVAGAKVMRRRLSDAAIEFGVHAELVGHVGTLHSAMLRLLRSVNPAFSVVLPEDADEILLATAKAFKDKTSITDLKALRSQWWRECERLKVGNLMPAQRTVHAYYARLLSDHMLDYDGILWRGFSEIRKSGFPWGVLFVDEFQDSGAIDLAIYDAINAEFKTLVGDSDQCQPAGTLVRMSDGTQRPIEKLSVGDEVVSYARHEKVLVKREKVNAIRCRTFSGLLYTVSAGNCKTECTGNHKWLIKWLTGADRALRKWCVYLMQKGDKFRIGKSEMFRSGGKAANGIQHHIIGAALRMNQERADNVWILSIHDSNADAVAQEDITAATHGLAQTCFHASGYGGYTQASIDKIFKAIPNQSQKAIRCLNDHGRDIRFPIVSRFEKRTRRTVQEIQACNLLPEIMHVPVHAGPYDYKTREGKWHKIDVTCRQFSGDVFSLEISKHHKYVADGIVTCNSIYRFRGGCVQNIIDIAAREDWTHYKLTTNYRSATAIVEASQRLIRNNTKRVPLASRSARSDVGRVECKALGDWRTHDAAICETVRARVPLMESGGWNEIAVLASTNAVAWSIADALEKQGVPALMHKRGGLPVDWKMTRLLITMLAQPMNWGIGQIVLKKMRGFDDFQIRDAKSQGTPRDYFKLPIPENMTPEVALNELGRLGAGTDSILAVRRWIDKARPQTMQDLQLGIMVDDEAELIGAGVYVGTIHSAKGREWKVVVLAACEERMLPFGKADDDDNIQEQRRLAYVAATRAKDELWIYSSAWREFSYGQFTQQKDTGPSRFIAEMQIAKSTSGPR